MNRDELARQLACSLPTVSALIKRWPDFPVVDVGGKGRPWRFDAGAVVEFLRQRRAEEEAADAERSELLAQLTLPIGRAMDPDRAPITLDDELKTVRVRAALRDEWKEAGFLVPTTGVRLALERAWRRLGIGLDSALDRVARAHNLPDPVKRALAREFADARDAFVRDAGEYLMDGEVEIEQLALAAFPR